MRKTTEIIRGLREDRDLSQKDIANIIGTTQQQYSKYERDNAELPVKALLDLSDFYKVSTDYLLCKAEFSGKMSDLDKLLTNNPKIAQLLSDIQTLSNDSQKAIFEYVRLQILKEKADIGTKENK